MDDKMKSAIEGLDPSDDTHWNQKGLPDLNRIKELTGKTISRAKFEAVCTLTRSQLKTNMDAGAGDGPDKMEKVEAETINADEVGDVSEVLGEDIVDDFVDDVEADEADEAPADPIDHPDKMEKVEAPDLVDPTTGEPVLTLKQAMVAMEAMGPGSLTADEAGAVIIRGLDALHLMLTPEVRRHQPEVGQVFQLYAAERPSILERQKRLAARRNR